MLAAPVTSNETAGLGLLIPTLKLLASTKNVFEMEAVIPELDAISKNVSGVRSPKPNLPSEVEAKTNLPVPESWNKTSLLKIQSPVTVSF